MTAEQEPEEVTEADIEDVSEVEIDAEEAEDTLRADISERVNSGDIKVPPFPQAVMELNRLEASDASFDAFVNVVARDPALAARVLRVANSAGIGNKEPITTLGRAVRSLGTSILMRIALADGVMAEVCRDGLLVAHKDRAWRQAVTSALLSSSLAPLRSLPAQQVFVCGLLHDFGRLIAAQVIEEIVSDGRLLCLDDFSDEVWSELIDHHHIRLGEMVAESWLLPEMIEECITTHHQPRIDSPHFNLVQLLVAVDAVIDLLERDPSPTRADVAAVSGLSAPEVSAIFTALSTLPAVISSFSIERPARAGSKPAPPSIPTLHARVKALAVASKRCFEVESMTKKMVVLEGDEGLALHQVFRVRFELPLALELWLRVINNQRSGGRVLVSACPFALTDADADAWQMQIQMQTQTQMQMQTQAETSPRSSTPKGPPSRLRLAPPLPMMD